MALTHIDSVISKDSIKASSSVGQVEGLPVARVGRGLLGVELCVCVCEQHRSGLFLEPFHKHFLSLTEPFDILIIHSIIEIMS